jgi:Phage phiEco32-like COOH.NH2 ligase-type 2
MRLGCDPEIFLKDAAGGLVASCGLIGGTKEEPRSLPIGPGYAVQEDNVAIEFNTPPASSSVEFVNSINTAMDYLRKEIAEQGLVFGTESAALFPKAQLIHPAALVFGCDPDYNAWTRKPNPRPKAADETLRSAGGHIHIGDLGPLSNDDMVMIIKLMDVYAGVPSVRMDNGILRKELYGKRGAFRPKPYGLEYRTLSNFWVFDSSLVDWAWRATSLAVDAWRTKTINPDEDDAAILDAIDNNNQNAATYLIEKYNLLVV